MNIEQTNYQLDLSELQSAINPSCLGIFWFTKQPLQSRPRPFEVLDYFFDGCLTQKNRNPISEANNKHVFISKHFDKPFVLAHFQANLPELKDIKDIMEFYKLSDKNLNEDREREFVLVINEGQTPSELDKFLQSSKKYIQSQPKIADLSFKIFTFPY